MKLNKPVRKGFTSASFVWFILVWNLRNVLLRIKMCHSLTEKRLSCCGKSRCERDLYIEEIDNC